jgi:hypothetical protein
MASKMQCVGHVGELQRQQIAAAFVRKGKLLAAETKFVVLFTFKPVSGIPSRL